MKSGIASVFRSAELAVKGLRVKRDLQIISQSSSLRTNSKVLGYYLACFLVGCHAAAATPFVSGAVSDTCTCFEAGMQCMLQI
jgi:hypothetical protein